MKSPEIAAEIDTAPKGTLLRILGVGFGLAVVIGGTIGAGILRLPGIVADQLGNVWLIIAVWVLGGVYALLGSLSVVELGAMLPRAGGFYVYARRAFGDYIGFTVGWTDWLASCATIAYAAIAIGEYSTGFLPVLAGAVKWIAIISLSVFALLHWLGVRLSSRLQQLTSLTMALAFLSLVAACFIYGGNQQPVGAVQTELRTPATFSGMIFALIIALRAVIVTYDGWFGVIYFAEEDRDPARNLPRAMIGGVLSVAIIYVLINLALLYTLSLPQLAASKLPAADAAQIIFGSRSGQIITALSLVTLLSLINSTMMGASRVMFALGRDRLFSERAAAVNSGGSPGVAMILSALAAMALAVTGTFEKIVAIAAIFFVANYTICFLSLFVLRKREPDLPRPFKAWGYPWTTMIVLFGSLAFLIGAVASDPINSLYALTLIAVAYPIHLAVKRNRQD